MEKVLYIIRGIPGSGKSTFAKMLVGEDFFNDQFYREIAVSNTFTQEWEMRPYFELAKNYGYKVFSVVVENRHGGTNQHGVPEEVLTKMCERFEITL